MLPRFSDAMNPSSVGGTEKYSLQQALKIGVEGYEAREDRDLLAK
jgi:hypothetical protein